MNLLQSYQENFIYLNVKNVDQQILIITSTIILTDSALINLYYFKGSKL